MLRRFEALTPPATCMNYSLGIDTNGEGPWNIEVGLCRDNDRYQQWLIEPLK